MFSYPSGFINGQMFICTFGSAVMLRLSEEDRAAFLKLPGAAMFEPTPGRPMKQYVRIPDNIWASDKKLDKWITKSMTYAASLPPKKPRTRKKPAAKK